MYNFDVFKNEVEKITEWLKKEFLSLNVGRATPAILENVRVDSFGVKQAIAHVASISIEDAHTLRVAPWDKKMVKEIERAIISANIGLTVLVDDEGLRVLFPELTGERRTALVKIMRDKLEETRVSVRKEREKAWNEMQEKEKSGDISKDDKFRLKDELQKLVDEANETLENILQRKEQDIQL